MGSWVGIKMRNHDGRTGVIRSEFEGFAHRHLTIAVDDGAESTVELSALGNDSGETGWYWLCENFSCGPAWLLLGDHNKTEERILYV